MTDICHQLHQLVDNLHPYGFPFDTREIPENGIYILFEDGELGHGTNRIVRVGTHTGNNQLRSRLCQHFLNENKDRSIFRKHIGRALLARNNDPFLSQWEIDLTSRLARINFKVSVDAVKLRDVESRVTEYIRAHIHFVVVPILQKEDRLKWEAKLISTVSSCSSCRPSMGWLGLDSPKTKIRESGLWIVNQLYKQPLDQQEFKELASVVRNS